MRIYCKSPSKLNIKSDFEKRLEIEHIGDTMNKLKKIPDFGW
jgi:hypothetical protein